MSPLDRRRFPRVHAPIFFRPARARFPFARPVQDVSLGGLRIYADEPLRPGDRFELELFLPDRSTLTFEAEVAWIHPLDPDQPARFDVGLAFPRLSALDAARLSAAFEAPQEARP